MYAFGFGPTLVAYMLHASTDEHGVSSANLRLLWGSSEIGPALQGYRNSSLSLEGSVTGYIRPRILYVGRLWRVPGFGVLPVACPWEAPLDVARTTRPLRHGFF